MSYLAQGLNQGFQIGSAMNAEKKRKKERADELAAERALKLDMQAKDAQARQALQNDQLVHDAKKQFTDQNWRSGERRESQSYGTSEREGSQQFTAKRDRKSRTLTREENAADRALRREAQDKELNARASEFNQTQPLRQADFSLRSRAQNWAESPENPFNRLRTADATGKEQDYGMGGPQAMAPAYKSIEDVQKAYQGGKLTRAQAAEILKKQFNIAQ